MLNVTELEGKRVLMTTQVAEAYSVEAKSLMRNFQRNKEHFLENTHYFALTGEALKRFKGERQNDATLKYASNLYLWTEQGAFLLAKSLQSEKAWGAYNMLVGQYYNVSQQIVTTPPKQPLSITYEQIILLEERVTSLEEMLKQVTLHSGEQIRLRNAVGERVHALATEKGARPALFRAIYSAIKERYSVGSYRDVKQHELQDALRFVAGWGEAYERHN